ncbi:MAG TPA: hypothetical protein VH880_04050 [Anaeromyxobacteraceae bacterium]|jgi:hypothetical protein
MHRLCLAAALAAALLAAAPASAQLSVQVQVDLGLPPQPALVEVEPGVQVVADFREEVFLSGGYYWLRRDAGWYRARRPNAAFVHVEPARVPPGLVRLPPGHYRHYRKEQARDERHAWKEQRKAERKGWKAGRKAEKREWKEHDREDRGGHRGARGHD